MEPDLNPDPPTPKSLCCPFLEQRIGVLSGAIPAGSVAALWARGSKDRGAPCKFSVVSELLLTLGSSALLLPVPPFAYEYFLSIFKQKHSHVWCQLQQHGAGEQGGG